MKAHRQEFSLAGMCRVLKVHRSGYYAWLSQPQSARAIANVALTHRIRICMSKVWGFMAAPGSFMTCAKRESFAVRTAWPG